MRQRSGLRYEAFSHSAPLPRTKASILFHFGSWRVRRRELNLAFPLGLVFEGSLGKSLLLANDREKTFWRSLTYLFSSKVSLAASKRAFNCR